MGPRPMAPAPLAGTRVPDLSNFLAAPIASMFPADFGCGLLKAERPGVSDELRKWGENKDDVGLYYKLVNRGKRSVTFDLRTPFGVEAVKRLIRDVDVAIENYRPGTIERWGLGYDVLKAINSPLVMLRVSGFGQTGPHRARPGFGTLAEAYAGYAHISGYPDGAPLLLGFGLADATTGLMGAYLVSVALHEAQRSGRGQSIDLAIYETLLTLLGPQVVNFDQLGIVQSRSGSRLPFTALRNTYRSRDGRWVSIAGGAQSTFERICAALEAPHISKDARFADNRQRLDHVQALDVAPQEAVGRFASTSCSRASSPQRRRSHRSTTSRRCSMTSTLRRARTSFPSKTRNWAESCGCRTSSASFPRRREASAPRDSGSENIIGRFGS
jgi:crotonobetainyl-CoA:carnitine CoA-transferase CaiB-like acyl-CoA transferase